MPVVRIDDATFAHLRTIADWRGFETPSKAIQYLASEEAGRLDLVPEDVTTFQSIDDMQDVQTFDRTPGLSFTRVLSASVDGQLLEKANWAGILLATIQALRTRGRSPDTLKHLLQVPSRIGAFDREGYKFYPDAGLSIQGQSAPDAWKETERLARKHSIPIDVEFQWRDNDKAQYPGQIGRLSVGR